MDLAKLKEVFSPEEIEWRVQRSSKKGEKQYAVVLAYVTNRAIMDRLDEVCGPDNWKNEYEKWNGSGVKCGISIKVGGEWVTKYDGADETDIEATKGGFSSSMKRAAVQWGIGRYLYGLDTNVVDVTDQKSNGNYINDKKSGVQGYWKTPDLPDWAKPKGSGAAKESASKKKPGMASDIKDVPTEAVPTAPTKEIVTPSNGVVNGGNCKDCGKDVPKFMADKSAKEFGRTLCLICQNKIKASSQPF